MSQNDERAALLSKGVSPTQDLLENGADSPFSLLAGEDRLSSTAMESFTQSPAAFPNCFACHNTQAVTARGVPVDKDSSSAKLLEPKLINISHVFSQFVPRRLHDLAANGRHAGSLARRVDGERNAAAEGRRSQGPERVRGSVSDGAGTRGGRAPP